MRWFLGVVCVLVVSACPTPPASDGVDAGRVDGGAADGGRSSADGGRPGVDAGAPRGRCSGTLVECDGGQCVDGATDILNCGGCGVTCGNGEVCNAGHCELLPHDCVEAGHCAAGYACDPSTRTCLPGCRLPSDCPSGSTCQNSECTCGEGTHRCGFACASDTSAESCGASCTTCPLVANAQATCRSDGACAYVCDEGHLSCHGACLKCTPPENAVAACPAVGDGCDFECLAGYHRCGDACVADTSVDGCGTSCSSCEAPANALATCDGQPLTCGFACRSDATTCRRADGGVGCTTCLVPVNGAVACDDSSCAFSCLTGFHRCGGECTSDRSNTVERCGMSCTPCGAPAQAVATCDGVACGFRCLEGLKCGAACCSVVSVSRSSGSTCAITSAGGAKCWGDNSYGQLGDGTTSPRQSPADVIGLTSGTTAISAAYAHTCAVTGAGGVKCWGDNAHGQLGDGTTTPRRSPVDVVGLTSGVAAVSTGERHTCALTTSGRVKCWGGNFRGQLGDGTFAARHTAVEVPGLDAGVVSLSAGSNHTCAVLSNGEVQCWGDDVFGQLGNGLAYLDGGSPDSARSSAGMVLGLDAGVAAVSAGGAHTCVLTSGGGVKCWGDATYGQLGEGSRYAVKPLPVDVVGLSSGASAVSAGSYFTCALTQAGAALCWGANYSGQVGDGSDTPRTTPVEVVGLAPGVSAVTAGGCAITSEGLFCWGPSYGLSAVKVSGD